MLFKPVSVNQIVPSAAVPMPKSEVGDGRVISVMADVLVAFVGMRPTRFPPASVKYNALSDPAVMPVGKLPAVGRGISEMSEPLVAVTGI